MEIPYKYELELLTDPELITMMKARESARRAEEEWANAPIRDNAKAISRDLGPLQDQANAILRTVDQRATPKTRRVMLLHKIGSMVSKASETNSACGRCTTPFCCHIPVAVPPAEAEYIGKRIGVKPASPRLHMSLPETASIRACTFLGQDGRCQIYEHRPMECRLQVNLDVDPLLCALIDGEMSVPYLNVLAIKKEWVGAIMQPMADLRDFFPDGLGAQASPPLPKR